MKIILSRKGFDASAGGTPSPILPDGTMLSMPIPNDLDPIAYADIYYDNRSYADYLSQLYPKYKWEEKHCHLDPDIRKGTLKTENWKPAFGQEDIAETHLRNHNIQPGDLFLFFGWFCQTMIKNGLLQYCGPNIQAIYGYLQYGKKVTGDEIYKWHPHSKKNHMEVYENNALYIPSKRLLLDEEDFGPGSGVFTFNPILQLTKPEYSRSKWSLLPWMNENLAMTYHSQKSIKDGYFQSVFRGQEFVIDANQDVITWVKSLFASQK